jgi:holin-like protein
MLGGLVVILICQLVGVFVVAATGLPVPGPVVGMVLFLVILMVRRPPDSAGLARAGDLLLRYLPLFFVPAGVGIVSYLPLLAQQWLPVTVGLFGSWFLALAVTGAVATLLSRWRRGRGVAR